ncbi:MAG: energy transducer TonB [Terriglobales bacterium]|jgi:protein TonB
MPTNMFHTLESTWDQSARRGWTTVASFTMQALALSLLLLIPFFTIQGPPRLAWFDPAFLAPPPAPPAPAAPARRLIRSSPVNSSPFVAPSSIPHSIVPVNDVDLLAAPDVREIGVPGGTGVRGNGHGILNSVGDAMPISPLPPPVQSHPLRISHWAEGNLIYRVQPNYPPLARAARIQGIVQLRAVISRTGTIENLTVLNGHAMLVTAAVEAVRQWRYRPYLLNGEPIEVETEITVNFTLAGN